MPETYCIGNLVVIVFDLLLYKANGRLMSEL